MAAEGRPPEPAPREFMPWLHHEFCRDVPTKSFWSRRMPELPPGPGEWRSPSEHDADSGRHLPPPGKRVAASMSSLLDLNDRARAYGPNLDATTA